MYSKKIAEQLIGFLDKNDWHYKFEEEKGVITLGISLEGKVKSCEIHLLIKDNFALNLASIEIGIDEESRISIAEFITRVNYGLTWGNFEMDFNDGELRYRMALDFEGIVVTEKMIERFIVTPALMYKRYGDGFLKVLFGLSSPKDAVEGCEVE